MNKTYKCYECGSKMVGSVQPYVLDEAGLKVTLEKVEIRRCRNCGEDAVALRKLGPLMRAIAATIVTDPYRFGTAEVRFLRTFLGWQGTELAQVLGVTKVSVSRWETGKAEISSAADRALRFAVLLKLGRKLPLTAIKTITKSKRPGRLAFRLNAAGKWARVDDIATQQAVAG